MHVSSDFWQITNNYMDNINVCSLVISRLNAMDSVQRLFCIHDPDFENYKLFFTK